MHTDTPPSRLLYSAENRPAKKAAQQKAWRDKNRERHLAKKRAHYQENKIAILAKQKEYYTANREKILERQKQEPEANRARVKAWVEKYPEKRKAQMLRERQNLSDGYVRVRLTNKNQLTAKDIPAELVEAKRFQLLIQRELKKGIK